VPEADFYCGIGTGWIEGDVVDERGGAHDVVISTPNLQLPTSKASCFEAIALGVGRWELEVIAFFTL
jgi:hypothetical protein